MAFLMTSLNTSINYKKVVKDYNFSLPIACFVLALASSTTSVYAENSSNLKVGISGHYKMYLNAVSQNGSVHAADILRDTDVTLSGETEFENDLKIGVIVNADGDAGDDFAVEDSFAYISGNWGMLSIGAGDGAAFLLQVAAPSADANVDGLETFITPFNLTATGLAGTHLAEEVSSFGLDYDNDITAGIDKLTFLTPVFGGLQIGISYTPDVANYEPASRSLNGNNSDNDLDEYGSAWEVGAILQRDVTQFIHANIGAGYTHVGIENKNVSSVADDLAEWNIATDFDFTNATGRNVGLGMEYTEKLGGASDRRNSTTFVVGVDYIDQNTSPWTYGFSWLYNEQEELGGGDINTNRLTLGSQYRLLPGVSLHGTISHLYSDVPRLVGGDFNGTSLTLGTQILF